MPVTSIGIAAPGWPATGAAIASRRIHMVSRNLDKTRVAEVSTAGLTLVRERSIVGGDGAWAAVTAPGGQVLLGLFGARGDRNVVLLGTSSTRRLASIDALYLWDAAVDAERNRAVLVTGQPSGVVAVDLRDGTLTALPILQPGQHPRTVAVAGGTVVVGGTDQRGRAFLVAQDLFAQEPGRSSVRDVLPPDLAGDDMVYIARVGPDGRLAIGTTGPQRRNAAIAVLDLSRPADSPVIARRPESSTVDALDWAGDTIAFATRPNGSVHILDVRSGAMQFLAVPTPMTETRMIDVEGDVAMGVSADGSVWRASLRTRQVVRRTPQELGITLRPQRAQAIGAGRGHVDVGGSFTITRHDTGGGPSRTRPVPGEPKTFVDVAGTMHFALYPVGELWFWRPNEDAPTRLTGLTPGQLRPMAMTYVRTHDLLAVTTTDDVSTSLLHLVDRRSGDARVLQPLPGQTVSGVVADGRTLYVGGSGNAPSVVAVDAVSGTTRWRVDDVVPGGSFVLGLQVVGNLLVVATVRGWVTTIDLRTRAVAAPVRVAGNAGQLRRTIGGLVLTTGDSLLRIDPARRTAQTLVSGLAAEYFNTAPMDVGPDGRIWALRGRELVHTERPRLSYHPRPTV